ncbi:MAG: glycosyltransferase family 39 protein, partial [Acidimicrobiales bacterium]
QGRFWPWVGAAAAVALAVRLAYVLSDDRMLPSGDGFDFRFAGLRLANGDGYTSRGPAGLEPSAHHPPGWATVLGAYALLGGRTFLAQQLLAVALGVALVVVVAVIGRRLLTARVGVVAAFLSAVYPGFWLLEGNVLSEPLGLVVLGLLILAIAGLREHFTSGRAVGAGVLLGLLTLVRSEQIALLILLVAPTVLAVRSVPLRRRLALLAAAAVSMTAVVAPWVVFNLSRFEEPVVLSYNGGGTLLAGNCGSSFGGEQLGSFDVSCGYRLALQHPELDGSQLDVQARSMARSNVGDHLSSMPRVVAARFGRAFAVFRPSQTVDLAAGFVGTSTAPIWAWVISFGLLFALAGIGWAAARAKGMWVLPLLGPMVLPVILVAVTYGEPRYHSLADLSIIVLAAAGLVRLVVGRYGWLPNRSSPSAPLGNAPAVTS